MGFISNLKDRMNQVAEKARTLLADEKVQQERVSICNSCEFLAVTRTCKKCGCFVDAKTKLMNQKCPVGKW